MAVALAAMIAVRLHAHVDRTRRHVQRRPATYNKTVNPIPDANTAAADLRARMRETRARLGAAQRIAAAEGVVQSLEQLPEFLVDRNVAGYWAIGGELPLHVAVAQLRARRQNYCVPVLVGREMRFAPLVPQGELRTNRFGIPEPVCAETDLLAPAQLDLVLVPLTAFDRRGGRLGMGGGYYDRSFAFLRELPRPAQPVLVGIGYSFQEVSTLDACAHDVAMDYVVTEDELIDCRPDAECDA
jgi:5-formyltetrahydrofolate cyclo-ligase